MMKYLLMVFLVGCAGDYVPESGDIDEVSSALGDDNPGEPCAGGAPPEYVHISCSAILQPLPGYTPADCSRAVCRSGCTNCLHISTCSEAQDAAKTAARQALVNSDPLALHCNWSVPIYYSCGSCLNGHC